MHTKFFYLNLFKKNLLTFVNPLSTTSHYLCCVIPLQKMKTFFVAVSGSLESILSDSTSGQVSVGQILDSLWIPSSVQINDIQGSVASFHVSPNYVYKNRNTNDTQDNNATHYNEMTTYKIPYIVCYSKIAARLVNCKIKQ